MRTKILILIGGLALILGPASGLSQLPFGGSKGKTKGSKGGFGPSSSVPGQPGGGGPSFGGRFSPGAPGAGGPSVGGRSFPGGGEASAPGMGGRSFPGGPGGGGNFGPGGGSSFGPGGGRGPDQFFNFLSGGKDVIVRAELDPRAQGMFDRIAEQLGTRDGQISRQQYQQYQARSSGAPAGFGPSSGSRGGDSGGDSRRGSDWSPEGAFRRFDRNGDGVLNFDEMPDDLQAERRTWDRDENGFIDPMEFTDYFRARMDYLREERGGPSGAPWDGPLRPQQDESRPVVYRAGRLPQGVPLWFSQYDRDADAQVGLYEWKSSGLPIDEFEAMDRNGDGFVTVPEVLRFTASPQRPDRSGPPRGGSPGTAVASRPSPGGPGGGGPGGGPPGMMGGRFGPPGGSREAGPGGSSRSGPPPGSSGRFGGPPSGTSGRFGGPPSAEGSGRSGPPSPGSSGRSGPGSGSSGRGGPGGRSSGSGGR